MEQEEKKQKSQTAENQASCSSLQPVEPHPFISVIPLAVLITLIVLVVKIFPDDALAGASQVALMIATAVCVALGMGIYRMKWNIFEEMIKKTVGDAGVSILILLLIGMMSATWMISGVVPTLIYYGVQIMSPTFFLPCACIISSIISVMTGTSWTTIATIGIALMGIGDALGIPAPYTAGAIISGAYFGDKLSPMSDTTVLASSIAGADLFSHIRYMLYTTIPSILLSLVLYLIIGLCYDSKPVDISQYLTGLSHGFNISLFTMLVPAFTGWLIYRKTPSLITLLLSALSACICALILQPEVLVGIAGEDSISAKSLFEGIMTTCYTHTQVDCGMVNINDLVATRGMAGMLNTIWLILCAMCFGSCMVASGMLHAITHMLLKSIHSTVSLVCSTVTSSQYLTGLSHGFNISLFTMLVPAFTGWLIYRKTPSLITLLLSALSACICALILQPEVLVGIAGEDSISAKSLFEGIMTTCYTHTQVDCGMVNINDLVATRGMAGMLNTIWLILCAMCFGSCMVASGMLHAITHMLLKSIHSTVSLVCSTVTSGVLLNLVMGDQFLSIIMNASIYKDEYAERGYRPELLSRSTEDSATVTSVLVPWTACGMTQSTVLGIPTLVYLPFCFFNIISPLMSCLVAILGFVPNPQPRENKASAAQIGRASCRERV